MSKQKRRLPCLADGTLRQGLSAQLEQSPFLSLLSDQRVVETLALMTQPKDARLTRELAHEVCQRTASAATICSPLRSRRRQHSVVVDGVAGWQHTSRWGLFSSGAVQFPRLVHNAGAIRHIKRENRAIAIVQFGLLRKIAQWQTI